MDKITTINGILMATQNDFNEHVEDATVHVTEEERTAWNAKADASALASHEENAAIHVSREENDTALRAAERGKYMDAAPDLQCSG